MMEKITNLDFMSPYLKWERYDTNRFLAHNDGGNFGQKLIHASCLIELHPQLPNAIDALLILAKNENGIAVTLGHHVGYTLNYLQGHLVMLNDTAGAEHYFKTICSIGCSAAEANVLLLGGYKCFTETVQVNTVSVCVVTYIDWREIPCSRSTLEQQHPGCYKKWKAGQQLGLDPTELTEMVFKANASASTDVTSIEGVTFD